MVWTLVKHWFWLVKFYLLVFVTTFPTQYMHMYLISCYHNSTYVYMCYTPQKRFAKYAIKLFQIKMSKLRNCLFKMKGIESNYSWRRSLRFSTRHFCLTIGHFKITQKGSFKVDSPQIGCYFWHFLTKRPIPWHFIFLK